MQSHSDDENEWYFAIASMMNPVSLSNRDVFPIKSIPAKLPGFRLHFVEKSGMAGVVPSEDHFIQGVAHLVTKEEMEKLDAIEGDWYIRQPATCVMLNEDEVEVTAYSWDPNKVDVNKPGIPGERYIQIMCEGCKHHGVDEEYVKWLENHPAIPRKSIKDCVSVSVPEDLPEMTMKEISEIEPVVTLNGKVFQFLGDDEKNYLMQNMYAKGLVSVEMYLSKVVYDPLYGIPESLEDIKREYCARIEDKLLSYIPSFGKDDWKLIGTFQQVYKE